MDAIAGLDEEGFRARLGTSAWSVAEILAHLLDYEQLWAARAESALDKDGFVITPRPEGERDPHLELARRQPVPQIVHGLLGQRRTTSRLLDDLSPEQLHRTFSHPRLGEHDLAWLFQRLAEHEDEHAQQIRALRGSAPAETP